MFAYVKCRCGRMLRAQRSPTRTTITCWDCRAEVVVPRFKSMDGGPGPVDRLRGAMVSSDRAETVAAVILLALATTAVIAIPTAGGWMAMGILVAAALFYIRRIESAGRSLEPEDSPEPVSGASARFVRASARLLLATAFVIGLLAVPWLADGSRQVAPVRPRVPPPGLLAIGLVLWIALPLVVYLLTARDEAGPIGPRRALVAAWRRRWATIATLLFPLIVLAATEAAQMGLFLATGNAGTFVLDLFPVPPGDRVDMGVFVSEGDLNFTREEMALSVYGEGLKRGATLVGSVPISFTRGLTARIMVPAYGTLRTEAYLMARLGVVALTMIAVYTALVLQSTWLGRIGLAAPTDEEDEEMDDAIEPVPSALRDGRPLAAGTAARGGPGPSG